jgi:hypothetical protein
VHTVAKGSCLLYCPIHFAHLLETALQVNVRVVGASPDVLGQSQPRSYALFAGLVGVQVVEDVLRDPGRGICSGAPPEGSSPARRCTRKRFETPSCIHIYSAQLISRGFFNRSFRFDFRATLSLPKMHPCKRFHCSNQDSYSVL